MKSPADRRAWKAVLFQVAVWAVAAPLTAAQTFYVNASNVGDPLEDGSADHPFDRIQEGIDASAHGDTVLVLAGTYSESIRFQGKAITVASAAGPADTILDGSTVASSLVIFEANEGRNSVLRGFTITHGTGYGTTNLLGGGIFCSLASPTIDGNVIIENRAYYGGGIYAELGNPLIINNLITGNIVTDNHRHLTGDGAGICLSLSHADIANNIIVDNTAQRRGGGIYFTDVNNGPPVYHVIVRNCLIARNRAVDETGGAINIRVCGQLTVRGCTIVENVGRFGGGIVLFGDTVAANISSSILYGNTGSFTPQELVLGDGSIADVIACDLEGGTNGVVLGDAVLNWGPGNIDLNPLFVQPGLDYRLRPCSPCVNTGDPAYVPPPGEHDVAGAARSFGGRVDIGAYELVYADCNANGSPDECECPADLNHDCGVSLQDLTILLSHFGTATGAAQSDGDLNSDGDVDLSDLTAFLSSFGQTCGG